MIVKDMTALLSLIEQLVNEERPYTLKRDALKSLASNDDLTNLIEFASWWVDEDKVLEEPKDKEPQDPV